MCLLFYANVYKQTYFFVDSMRFIITGGAGFIGSHIAEHLVNEGREVIVVDNLSTGDISNIRTFIDKINFIEGDILNLSLLNKTTKEGDYILHLAALPSVTRSVENPYLTNKVNIEGTLNVLMAARDKKAKRVVFASSSSIYGDSEALPKAESMCPNPKSPYALSKLAGEYYCKLFYKLYGVETVCLRYFNVFGPRQNPDSQYSAAIPKFINQILNNERPVVFGDGKQTRDFTYVSNVVNANMLALKSGKNSIGETINIACGKRVSLLEIIQIINASLQKNILPLFKEARKGDVKHSLADINKAISSINYQPITSFEQGLKLTLDFQKSI